MKEKADFKSIRRPFNPHSYRIINVLLLAAALLSLAFSIYAVFICNLREFDEKVFEYFTKLISNNRTDILLIITFLGGHIFLIPANLLLIIYFLVRKKNRIAIRILALSLSSLGLMLILKNSIQRARPDTPLLEMVSGYSFPSGHALISVVFYGFLIFITIHEIKNRWLRVAIISLLIFLIIFISLSRIYLRVHYTTDVLAGLSVGSIWLILSLWLIKKTEAVLASGNPSNFKKSNN